MQSGGRIIMIGSAVGERALTSGLVPYSATKGAVKMFAQGCPERWEAGASQSTISSRVRLTRMRIQPRANGRYRRRHSQHSTVTGALMRSLRWWRCRRSGVLVHYRANLTVDGE